LAFVAYLADVPSSEVCIFSAHGVLLAVAILY